MSKNYMKYQALFCLYSLGCFASSFSVDYGTANASIKGNALTIMNSEGAVLSWDAFSIPQDHRVHFAQEHTKSLVLNRVLGAEKSLIEGILSSNGKVMLVNPYGIHISSQALIETAGFIASTMDVANGFEELFFHNPRGGEIMNEGSIRCPDGEIIFAANTIRNLGHCEGHFIAFLTGDEILIKPDGKKRIFIKTNQTDSKIPSYERAIAHEGTVTTYAFEEMEGRVYLMAKDGTLDINGKIETPSGQIHLLGETVYLGESAKIDASGVFGGEVLVGGDYQGSNPDLFNAKTTKIAEGAEIFADGFENAGGKIILWADGTTEYRGLISAQALGKTGDGGFVEVSSKGGGYLFAGKVDTSSKNGKTGTLLLDPVDITIDGGVTSPALTTPNYAPAVDANINVADLAAALMSSNVNIFTNGGATGSGDITLSSSLTFSGGSLSLNADRDITFTAAVTNNGSGAFNATAAQDVIISAGADIGMNGGGDLAFTAARQMTITNADITSSAGNISLTASGIGSGFHSGLVLTAAQISTTGNGDISLTGNGEVGVAPPTLPNDGISINSSSSVSCETGTMTLTGTGTANGPNGYGVKILGVCSTTNGSITIDATSADDDNQGGILLDGGILTATGTGSIELTSLIPMPGFALSEVFGIRLQSDASISTTTGSISMTATSNTPDDQSAAISIENTALIETTSGSITMIGIGPYHFNNSGVQFLDDCVIQSVDGGISITGSTDRQGLFQSGNNAGVLIDDNTTIQTTGKGDISISGTALQQRLNGETGSGDGYGIRLNVTAFDSPTISTNEGAISLTGTTSGMEEDEFYGIICDGTFAQSSLIQSVQGSITLDGTCALAGGANFSGGYIGFSYGVALLGQIVSDSGLITINGTTTLEPPLNNNYAGVTSNGGVYVDVEFIDAESSDITIRGIFTIEDGQKAGLEISQNPGVYMDFGTVQSNSGSIAVYGEINSPAGFSGLVNDEFNDGIYLVGGEIITDTGMATLTGLGSLLPDSHGIHVEGSFSAAANNGSISFIGTGMGDNGNGVLIEDGPSLTVAGGVLVLNGTGSATGDSWGVQIQGPTTPDISGTGGDIQIIGASQNSSEQAFLIHNGGLVTTSGRLTLDITGDAFIQDNGILSPLQGPLAAMISRDLTVSGGPLGIGQIGSASVNSSASMQVQADRNVIVLGNGGNYGVIGHGDPAEGVLNLEGTIRVSSGLDINVLGGAASEFAQIGHVNQTGGGSTLGGDIVLNAAHNINIIGGSAAYARVGHGGQMGAANYLVSDEFLLAGLDLNITSNAGEAEVVNLNGPLTLVVDNLYPTFPGFGNGSFHLNSNVSSTGPLKIYTVTQNQNTVNDQINGANFVPGPFDVNSATEEWSIYFSDGSYEGAPFKFYYKFPLAGLITGQILENIAANLVALNNLSPNLHSSRLPPSFPAYHFIVCDQYLRPDRCTPTLSPYGSFIFEDALWWTDWGDWRFPLAE